MTSASLSIQSAIHKFEGTKPYRQLPHFFVLKLSELEESIKTSPEESFFCLFGEWSDNFHFDNCSLVEMMGYEDNCSHLFLLKRTGVSTFIEIPKQGNQEIIKSLGISFICTDDEPYFPLLKEAIEYYKNIDLNLEINVIFYTDTDKEIPNWDKVTFLKQPRNNFNMSNARNLGLKQINSKYVFMLDVDVRLSKNNIDSILKKFQTIPNNGVFNLKNDPKIGNGLYFGEKEILMKNGYNEEFKLFWGEDTEYLMNFSRIGIIPIIVFEDFIRIDHTRDKTLSVGNTNFNLMSNIIHKGHR